MIYCIFFIFGICFGSFCNVMIYRMPQDKSIIFPASHCPKCKNKLHLMHNIPILSWIFLKRKCTFCKEKISILYPICELTGGILAVLALYINGDLLTSALLGICFILLFTLSIIDLKYNAVPESLLISTYFIAIFSVNDTYLANFSALINSFIFAGAITILKSIVSLWINRHNNGEIIESMGDGDTIIIAIIGALAGILVGLATIFLAAILQIILHIILRKIKGKVEAPFIPSLSLALIVSLSFYEEINNLIFLIMDLK